jgi:hypothetical protein
MDYVQQKDDKGYTKIQKVGMAPIQRDGFEYEFDVVMDMDTDHRGIISKTRCPELTDGVYKFPGETVAGILNEWLNSGAASVDIAKAKKEIEILTPSNYFVDAPDTENPDNIENVIEPDDSPSDMALEVIGEWTSRLKAQAWAVEIGACKNDIEATNSMYKVIARHGGKVTKENVNAVYFDFYCRQIEKLEEMQQKPELMAA